MFNNKRGFTLAEVLVTLGIIGVVAVLTVPNVISSYQKKVYVAQLQKAYNQISNAVALLMVDEEVDNLNDTYLNCHDISKEECTPYVGQFLKKYFKISKDCEIDYENNECTMPQYKLLNGEDAHQHWCIDTFYTVVLNSGASLSMQGFLGNPAEFIIDVNGKKKPNVFGRDVFLLDINCQGEISESFHYININSGVYSSNPDNCPSNPQGYGLGCFNKIINDGWKMDY